MRHDVHGSGFPLHDMERLERWLQNMKRGSWVPTKHHYLCSDHFTPDSFDIRWGIRYLKPNAVPTVFCATQNIQERDHSKQDLKIKERKSEKISEIIELNSVSGPSESYSPIKIPTTIEATLEKSIKLHLQPNKHTLKMAPVENIECGTFSSLVNLLNSSALPRQHTKLDQSLESKDTGSIIEDSPENSVSLIEVSSVDIQQTNENSLLFSASTQTIEQFNTTEDSIITIILPAKCFEDPSSVASSIASPQQLVKLENSEFGESFCKDMDSGSEVLQIEHSYCRQNVDKDRLWQKIAILHSKITVLEVQERKTLSRLRSLEALIGQLKQENLLSEEKLRIVENCFTTFEVTMI
uniref:THAP domain-containing protein 5 n=1 Tax=Geotrypetes seraphini TaxID=260995 RepID=A0A6P8S8E5_GEOSA|nr:THAP domain-containing protein 5 isoform X2 [Geotrypetes seraphini]